METTTPPAPAVAPPIDGRRARREQTRAAVIDAVFALVEEGTIPPTIDDVAARSGVSASSIFRNFEGLADVQHRTIEAFGARFASSFEVDDADQSLQARITSHVRGRVALFETAGAMLRIGRARALDHEPIRAGMAGVHENFAEQTRQRFGTELSRLTRQQAQNLAALIDATTSPTSFELMADSYGRTSRHITATWTTALSALFAQ